MQDEVREKSVAFVIRVGKNGGKLTASMLKYAIERYLEPVSYTHLTLPTT